MASLASDSYDAKSLVNEVRDCEAITHSPEEAAVCTSSSLDCQTWLAWPLGNLSEICFFCRNARWTSCIASEVSLTSRARLSAKPFARGASPLAKASFASSSLSALVRANSPSAEFRAASASLIAISASSLEDSRLSIWAGIEFAICSASAGSSASIASFAALRIPLTASEPEPDLVATAFSAVAMEFSAACQYSTIAVAFVFAKR